MKIKSMTHITNDDPEQFSNQLAEAVKAMQGDGLYVEVQYQQSDRVVSALVVGRVSE